MTRTAADPALRERAPPSFTDGETVFLRKALTVRVQGIDEDGKPVIYVRLPTTWGGTINVGVRPYDLVRGRPPPSSETPG